MLIRVGASLLLVACALVAFSRRPLGTSRALPPSAVVTMDWLRGLAAVAVLFGHVRGLFMQDFEALRRPSPLWKAFYLLSGFGHQSVIVFFILSGFLVGATVLARTAEGRWSFSDYLSRRLARLYVVLLPGLLLTAVWDLAGMHCFGSAGLYGGNLDARFLDMADVTQTLSWGHFLGNLAFLQHLFIRPFGSNNPLWSLPYELWAYVLFPPLLRACGGSLPLPRRGAYLLITAGALALGGYKLALYFGIWLLGALVALWWRSSSLAPRRWLLLPAWGLFGASLVLARLGRLPDSLSDLQLGVATALALAVTLAASSAVVERGRLATLNASAAAGLAGFSYTLYVVHYPVLTFVFAGWMDGKRWPAGMTAVASVLGLSLVLMLYAFVVARLTEAHTERVRMKLRSLMRTSA